MHPGIWDLLNLVARFSLREEDALAQLSLDKSYIFFFNTDEEAYWPKPVITMLLRKMETPRLR